jgi:hypothetical protein
MGGHALGDALAARQAGAEELVGVGAVHLRARRAAGGSACPARLQQHPVRLTGAVDHSAGLPGGGVDVLDRADQPHGPLAVAGDVDLPAPPCVAIRVPAAGAQLREESVIERDRLRVRAERCGYF